MIQLSKQQKDMLWWENWPYSEAKLTYETRILDDEISRQFISVSVNINPTTYEICKQNVEVFSKNLLVSQLIEHAENNWVHFWYEASAFSKPFTPQTEWQVLEEAKIALEYSKQTIVEMHQFVMQFLDIKK